jgi:hypothetical protein
MGNEQRLLSSRIELRDDLALAWACPFRGGETRARQLLATCFSLRDARSIGRIELVPRIAAVIHYARRPSVPRQCEVDWSPFWELSECHSRIRPPGKRVQFDQETWDALDLLAKDSMRDFQDLAAKPSPIC